MTKGSDRPGPSPMTSHATPPAGTKQPAGREVAFRATHMAERLLRLVRADPTSNLVGEVNPGALAGFFVNRAGRRYYVRVEEVLCS